MTEVRFPVLKESEPDAEGLLATWFVEDGDEVGAGQLLAEVQVDKSSEDVHSESAGTVSLAVAEGDVVRQGSVVARIE